MDNEASSVTKTPEVTDKDRKVYSDKQLQYAMAEYSALRDEILKRSEFRYQILSLNVVIFGTILTFSLQSNTSAYILFVFPVLAYCLAGIWAHNLRGTRRLSRYIREHIANKFDIIGWESDIQKEPRFSPIWSSLTLSTSGIFLGTEIITTVLGLIRSTFTTLDYALVVCNSIVILLTLVVLRSATRSFK